ASTVAYSQSRLISFLSDLDPRTNWSASRIKLLPEPVSPIMALNLEEKLISWSSKVAKFLRFKDFKKSDLSILAPKQFIIVFYHERTSLLKYENMFFEDFLLMKHTFSFP